MSNRIRLAVSLGGSGGFEAAVRRARLDRFTSAWPKLRPGPTPRFPSLGTFPSVPSSGTAETFSSPEGGVSSIPDGDTNERLTIRRQRDEMMLTPKVGKLPW